MLLKLEITPFLHFSNLDRIPAQVNSQSDMRKKGCMPRLDRTTCSVACHSIESSSLVHFFKMGWELFEGKCLNFDRVGARSWLVHTLRQSVGREPPQDKVSQGFIRLLLPPAKLEQLELLVGQFSAWGGWRRSNPDIQQKIEAAWLSCLSLTSRVSFENIYNIRCYIDLQIHDRKTGTDNMILQRVFLGLKFGHYFITTVPSGNVF